MGTYLKLVKNKTPKQSLVKKQGLICGVCGRVHFLGVLVIEAYCMGIVCLLYRFFIGLEGRVSNVCAGVGVARYR